MRILGFCKQWRKFINLEFTTFRYPRKDSDKGRDWHVGERVQIVLHPRSKEREVLGTAEIIGKEIRNIDPAILLVIPCVTNDEAVADGFTDWADMRAWFRETYGKIASPVMNKLTLIWIQKTDAQP